MKLIYETSTGIKLLQDEAGEFFSTNPAEVICCVIDDAASSSILDVMLATSLLDDLIKQGGIHYMDTPKRIKSDKRCVFLAQDEEGGNLLGISSALRFDFSVKEKLSSTAKLLMI